MRRLFASVIVALIALQGAAFAQGMRFGGPSDLVTLKPEISPRSAAPGDAVKVRVRLNVDDNYHIQSNKPAEDWIVPTRLTIAAPPGYKVSNIRYPAHELKAFSFAPDKKQAVLPNNALVTADLQIPATAKPGNVTLKAALSYQACDDEQCLPPAEAEESFSLTVAPKASPRHPGSAVTAPDPEEPNAAPESPSAAETPAESPAADEAEVADPDAADQDADKTVEAVGAPGESQPPAGAGTSGQNSFQNLVESRGWIFLIAAVFAAGLLLSLTPCVFPLIPVTLGYFQGQASSSRGRTVTLAVLYMLGIATTYSILGVIAAFSGALFGSWLANPFVLGGLALVIGLMGLSMFGLFELRPPTFITRRSGGKAGMGGAYAMGLLFGIVAAPCTGPATIALLAFVGIMGSPLLGLVLFFVLALGISTPLMLLAIFSASLPTSGVWMEWVKKFMGALMLGAALWLLNPLLGRVLTAWIGAGLAVSLGVYLGFLEKSGFKPASLAIARVAAGVLGIALGIWLLVPKPEGIAFEPYSSEAIAEARATGRPVMIDFSADWCLPCRELEEGAFKDPEAMKLSREFVLLKADITHDTADVRKMRREHNVVGVPAVVFYDPQGREVEEARVSANVPGEKLVQKMRMALSEPDTASR